MRHIVVKLEAAKRHKFFDILKENTIIRIKIFIIRDKKLLKGAW